MRHRLSELLIVSDIDGTLTGFPAPIPARNLEALRRFTKKGGRFAVATGRAVESAAFFVRQLPVNAPCVLFNGGALYDYETQRFSRAWYLPETFLERVGAVIERYPQIGAAMQDERVMCPYHNPAMVERYMGPERLATVKPSPQVFARPQIKMVLCTEAGDSEAVEAFGNAQGWTDLYFQRSGPHFVEVLPSGVDKGGALAALAELLGVTMDRTVAIGDYYNDLSMLERAGLSAAAGSAPDIVQAACDLVVCPWQGGAVAELVEYLEARCPE